MTLAMREYAALASMVTAENLQRLRACFIRAVIEYTNEITRDRDTNGVSGAIGPATG